MTGAVALTSIKNAFATPQFTSLKLKDAPLKAANGEVSDIVDLTNSATSLITLELPETIKKLTAGEFNGFEALTSIDMSETSISAIPDNAFKCCSALKSFALPDETTSIGKYAFYGTKLTGITIPAKVAEILDYAFANIYNKTKGVYDAFTLNISGAAELATLGVGVFYDTNVSGTVDFAPTKVYAIPTSAFAKSWTYSKDDKNFLSKVILKQGDDKHPVTIGDEAFLGNFYATGKGLTAVDNLNQAALTSIGEKAFTWTGITSVDLSNATALNVNSAKKSTITANAFERCPDLGSVTLPTNVAVIGNEAFAYNPNLRTVANLNQANLTKIGDAAFDYSQIASLDLSAATNLESIGEEAFGQFYNSSDKKWYPALTEIKFPAETNTKTGDKTEWKDFTNKIKTIGAGAFLGASKLTVIENLKDTKISILEQLFSDSEKATGSLSTDDDYFVDRTSLCPAGLTEIELPDTTWIYMDGATEVKIYLNQISDFALQGLGLTEIVIPSTVSSFGECVLQGNTALKKVEWYDAQVKSLHKYTFRGDSNMEEFYFMTNAVIDSKGITDEHFYWCSKDKLTVYVTAESLNVLLADGYTTANAKYSKLNDELTKEFEFKAAGKSGEYYYATYYNNSYATWFDATQVEVFTAVVKGAQVELVPADVENGYYKIKRRTSSNDKESVAIIRSKDQKVTIDLLALDKNNITTLSTANNALQVATEDMTVSKLAFQFKFGVGTNKTTGEKQVGFFRVTTGTFKKDQVYIQAPAMARMADFIGIDEATGIQNVEAVANDDAAVYNLQGARVNAAQKGIYIKNGKKFIVK